MSARKSNSEEDARIEEAAAEWLIKRDLGLSAEEQDAFFQWLGEDPSHGDAFARQQRTWKEFDLLPQWMPEHSGEPNPDLLARGKSKKRWVAWLSWPRSLALAASITLVFALFYSQGDYSGQASEVEGQFISAGEYGYHVLEDGSELDMNQGAEVSVEYSEGIRLVKLLAGEVHFTVAKNPNRPFVVRAGGKDVRAVGTAFNVLLGADSVEVLVTEGKVRVASTPSAARPLDLDTSRSGLDLVPGQRSVLPIGSEASAIEATQVRDEEMERLLSWKHELLDFDSTPLHEAVNEFNRRNEVQMIVLDEALGQEPIVASFRSNNLDGFARLLELTLDVEVVRTAEENIEIRKLP